MSETPKLSREFWKSLGSRGKDLKKAHERLVKLHHEGLDIIKELRLLDTQEYIGLDETLPEGSELRSDAQNLIRLFHKLIDTRESDQGEYLGIVLQYITLLENFVDRPKAITIDEKVTEWIEEAKKLIDDVDLDVEILKKETLAKVIKPPLNDRIKELEDEIKKGEELRGKIKTDARGDGTVHEDQRVVQIQEILRVCNESVKKYKQFIVDKQSEIQTRVDSFKTEVSNLTSNIWNLLNSDPTDKKEFWQSYVDKIEKLSDQGQQFQMKLESTQFDKWKDLKNQLDKIIWKLEKARKAIHKRMKWSPHAESIKTFMEWTKEANSLHTHLSEELEKEIAGTETDVIWLDSGNTIHKLMKDGGEIVQKAKETLNNLKQGSQATELDWHFAGFTAKEFERKGITHPSEYCKGIADQIVETNEKLKLLFEKIGQTLEVMRTRYTEKLKTWKTNSSATIEKVLSLIVGMNDSDDVWKMALKEVDFLIEQGNALTKRVKSLYAGKTANPRVEEIKESLEELKFCNEIGKGILHKIRAHVKYGDWTIRSAKHIEHITTLLEKPEMVKWIPEMEKTYKLLTESKTVRQAIELFELPQKFHDKITGKLTQTIDSLKTTLLLIKTVQLRHTRDLAIESIHAIETLGSITEPFHITVKKKPKDKLYGKISKSITKVIESIKLYSTDDTIKENMQKDVEILQSTRLNAIQSPRTPDGNPKEINSQMDAVKYILETRRAEFKELTGNNQVSQLTFRLLEFYDVTLKKIENAFSGLPPAIEKARVTTLRIAATIQDIHNSLSHPNTNQDELIKKFKANCRYFSMYLKWYMDALIPRLGPITELLMKLAHARVAIYAFIDKDGVYDYDQLMDIWNKYNILVPLEKENDKLKHLLTEDLKKTLKDRLPSNFAEYLHLKAIMEEDSEEQFLHSYSQPKTMPTDRKPSRKIPSKKVKLPATSPLTLIQLHDKLQDLKALDFDEKHSKEFILKVYKPATVLLDQSISVLASKLGENISDKEKIEYITNIIQLHKDTISHLVLKVDEASMFLSYKDIHQMVTPYLLKVLDQVKWYEDKFKNIQPESFISEPKLYYHLRPGPKQHFEMMATQITNLIKAVDKKEWKLIMR